MCPTNQPRRARNANNRPMNTDPFGDPFAGLNLNMHGVPPPPPPPIDYSSSSESEATDNTSDLDEDDNNEEEDTAGMAAETRHLYRAHGRKRWRTRVPKQKKWQAQSNKNAKYALVVRREKDTASESGLRLVSFTVQSPLLRQFLKEVFEGYHGISTKLKDLTFNKPFQEFVYRWDRYEELIKESTDETELLHVELLNDVLEPEVKPLVLRKREMQEQNLASFQLLWSLFEPMCEVYTVVNGKERILQLQSCEYQAMDHTVVLALYCKCIDYDGTGFGYMPYYVNIEQFEGHKLITELSGYPLSMHPDREGVIARLTERGKRFEQLKGVHYLAYTGTIVPSEYGRRSQKVADRRVIVDAEMYRSRSEDLQNNPGMPLEPLHSVNTLGITTRKAAATMGAYTTEDLQKAFAVEAADDEDDAMKQSSDGEKAELQEHQYRLCTSEIRGYCLKSKSWIKMQIDGIQDNHFNAATFKRLILPNDNKDLILSLIETHLGEDNKFDDIVEGKGKGMVVLLSGDPGIGKTLTAEAVAEQMEKPLFAMSAGQLGPKIEDVEKDLDDILEICSKWGAVLLLDEADVFLEKRQLTDIRRNKLVSVFLRLLEYYEGCMFLTTNRATSLDPAIKSRIDLHVDYGRLDEQAKRHIWGTFVKPSEDFPENGSEITDEELDVLAKLEINGREIKNLVKTGRLLARKKGEELGMRHLKTVLSVQTGVPMI